MSPSSMNINGGGGWGDLEFRSKLQGDAGTEPSKKAVPGAGASRGAGGPFEGSLGGAKAGHDVTHFFFEGRERGPGGGNRFVRIFASFYTYVD